MFFECSWCLYGKIAVGGVWSELVSLDEKPEINIKNLAKAKKDINELVIYIK